MANVIWDPREAKPTTKKVPGLKGQATKFESLDDGPAEEVDEFNEFIRNLRHGVVPDLKPRR
jgi:hypothetical protein